MRKVPWAGPVCLFVVVSLATWLYLSGWYVNESEGTAPPIAEEAAPLEILQYIAVHEENGASTSFSVVPGPDASEEYYVLIRPFFIVEMQLAGGDDPVKVLRSPEVIVRSHPGVAILSQPVPYQKKDLWQVRADVLLDKGWHYEFVQPGWAEFDPAKDLN